jgi:hypothetical protein
MHALDKYRQERNPVRRKAMAEALFLEFCNDFLTVGRFCEYYEDCPRHEMELILKEGRRWNGLPKVGAVTENQTRRNPGRTGQPNQTETVHNWNK